jgi:hypothetical protein
MTVEMPSVLSAHLVGTPGESIVLRAASTIIAVVARGHFAIANRTIETDHEQVELMVVLIVDTGALTVYAGTRHHAASAEGRPA